MAFLALLDSISGQSMGRIDDCWQHIELCVFFHNAVRAVDEGAKYFWAKLIRFGQN